MIELRDNGPEARQLHEHADASTSRSVYLPLLRGVTPRALEAFDPVEQTLVTGKRDATTVPSQALFLLNSSFVRGQALALAERLLGEDAPDAARVRSAYRLALGRDPTSGEAGRALAFVAESTSIPPESEDVAPVSPVTSENAPTKTAPSPANPDEVDQTGEPVVEAVIRPKDARAAAWLALAQALFASAEFRYVR